MVLQEYVTDRLGVSLPPVDLEHFSGQLKMHILLQTMTLSSEDFRNTFVIAMCKICTQVKSFTAYFSIVVLSMLTVFSAYFFDILCPCIWLGQNCRGQALIGSKFIFHLVNNNNKKKKAHSLL